MKHKQRNSTAEATAAMRAMHSLHHRPAVFNDPYALQLTSPTLRRVCQNRFFRWLIGRKCISRSLRPITAQVVSRAKYAEEKLEQAVSKGISQYVIISAGFDSFCLRHPDFSAGLQIYEIDHPATQQIKQKRLMEILDSSPKGVEFLAVDLEKQTIADALPDSSFLKDERAFFSWLGILFGIMYIGFAFGQMYFVMPIAVCPNCVYYRLNNSLCASGMNIFSRKMAKQGDLRNFSNRSKGVFCHNNMYLAALFIPIIAMIPALIFNFSYLLLAMFIIVLGLLLFRMMILFRKKYTIVTVGDLIYSRDLDISYTAGWLIDFLIYIKNSL